MLVNIFCHMFALYPTFADDAKQSRGRSSGLDADFPARFRVQGEETSVSPRSNEKNVVIQRIHLRLDAGEPSKKDPSSGVASAKVTGACKVIKCMEGRGLGEGKSRSRFAYWREMSFGKEETTSTFFPSKARVQSPCKGSMPS